VIRVPQTPHVEVHFTASDDVMPFALAAGLSGAVNLTRIIVTAGLAEIAAGSIAMGLGGYLAAKSDAQHYATERRREQREVIEMPREEMAEVADIFRSYGVDEEHIEPVVEAMRQRPKQWVDFMMRFELGMEKPNPKRARISAAVIAGAYIAGGLIPLLAVHDHGQRTDGALRVGRNGIGRSRDFRVGERALQRGQAVEELAADDDHGRAGSVRCISDRESNRIDCA
jgi:hypothetical protein